MGERIKKYINFGKMAELEMVSFIKNLISGHFNEILIYLPIGFFKNHLYRTKKHTPRLKLRNNHFVNFIFGRVENKHPSLKFNSEKDACPDRKCKAYFFFFLGFSFKASSRSRVRQSLGLSSEKSIVVEYSS